MAESAEGYEVMCLFLDLFLCFSIALHCMGMGMGKCVFYLIIGWEVFDVLFSSASRLFCFFLVSVCVNTQFFSFLFFFFSFLVYLDSYCTIHIISHQISAILSRSKYISTPSQTPYIPR